MGASTARIVRLLVWQFSRPVLWALLVALPLAYMAANTYLQFFADRIAFTGPIVGLAGVASVLLGWSIVAVHAYRVARENPIRALRYE
jgi:putative ABC transport system permease protein